MPATGALGGGQLLTLSDAFLAFFDFNAVAKAAIMDLISQRLHETGS